MSLHDATSLHDAIRRNDIPLVKRLITDGASLELLDENGMRPLHMAVRHGRFECVNLLLDANADINAYCDNEQIRLTPILYALHFSPDNKYVIIKVILCIVYCVIAIY